MARIPHLRRLRHRKLSGLGRGQLRYLAAWLTARSSALAGTGTAQVFTINATTEVVTIATHGHVTGAGPFGVSTTVTLPVGLSATALYWVNRIDANTLTLHRSLKDALNGLRKVEVSDTGTGTHSMTPATSILAIAEHLREGSPTRVTVDDLEAETDIDDIT